MKVSGLNRRALLVSSMKDRRKTVSIILIALLATTSAVTTAFAAGGGGRSTPTPTPTPTPIATATPTVSPSPTPTVTATPSSTPTPPCIRGCGPTPTPTASASATPNPSPTPTPTPTLTPTPTPTPTPNSTPTPTVQPSPTPTPTPTPTSTPSSTATPTPTPCHRGGCGPSPTPTPTPNPTVTPTPTPTATPSSTATPTPTATAGGSPSSSQASRFLIQSTLGPTTPLISQVQALGFSSFLDQQFAIVTTRTLPRVDATDAALPVGTSPSYPDFHEAWWYTVVTAPDQLRQRIAFALSEIMVISANGNSMYDHPEAMATYWDVLANDAFGNFRQLMEDVTLNPAMGDYLDMVHNDKPNIANNTEPNENYARELMQLFTIGLYKLNQDGSQQLDNHGQPIPTYDQDVVEGYARNFRLARCCS